MQNSIDLTKLLDTDAVAAILGVHPVTLRKARNRKTANPFSSLPLIRVGRAVRYRLDDVQAFITSNRQEVK